MKIKKFENWVSDVTGNVSVNYGGKPKISDVVKFTGQYIKDNIDNIRFDDKSRYEINFDRNLSSSEIKLLPIKRIRLEIDTTIKKLYKLKFDSGDYNTTFVILTEIEYNYLLDILYNVYAKLREHGDIEKVLSEIDPMKRSAKKYNL